MRGGISTALAVSDAILCRGAPSFNSRVSISRATSRRGDLWTLCGNSGCNVLIMLLFSSFLVCTEEMDTQKVQFEQTTTCYPSRNANVCKFSSVKEYSKKCVVGHSERFLIWDRLGQNETIGIPNCLFAFVG